MFYFQINAIRTEISNCVFITAQARLGRKSKTTTYCGRVTIPGMRRLSDSTFRTCPSMGCVVLIDEIDKAESDVPNGLLEALGGREFRPFGRTDPVRSSVSPPLVIVTTNNERALPDAFFTPLPGVAAGISN
jgi:MoxR-like ATPase